MTCTCESNTQGYSITWSFFCRVSWIWGVPPRHWEPNQRGDQSDGGGPGADPVFCVGQLCWDLQRADLWPAAAIVQKEKR